MMTIKKILFMEFVMVMLSIISVSAYAIRSPLPNGSYVQTCRMCTVSMATGDLECFCEDRNGSLTRTALPNASQCRFVENNDGYLNCTRWKRQPAPYYPQTDYTQKRSIEAGPIWNQQDAERKCPNVCQSNRSNWTGQWNTTQWARMSVCECEKSYREPRYYRNDRPNVKGVFTPS